jgi:hypothetical protein
MVLMELNPETGRMRKKCPAGYERNSNGKCVKKCKPTHERGSKGRCAKKCENGKVRNSRGKCVKTARPSRPRVSPNPDGRCVAPRCFKSDAGNCSHPNPWVMFLVNNKGKGFSMSTLKLKYRQWKRTHGYSNKTKETRNPFLCSQPPNADVYTDITELTEGFVHNSQNRKLISRAR